MHKIFTLGIIMTAIVGVMMLAAADIAVNQGNIGSSHSIITGNMIASKSELHKPNSSYINPFNRPGNFTIQIPKPNVIRGITPKITPLIDLKYDVVRQIGKVKLDPRTCQDNLAVCYQIIDHMQNRTTTGKNYTATSSYILPETRVRNFVCVGDDRTCVGSATNCYCPTQSIIPFKMKGENSKCSDTTHLCTNSYTDLKLCNGNLSSCQKKYLSCGCGTSSCIAAKNTCVDTRGSLVLCAGDIASCLKKYGTCYCGDSMMLFDTVCKTENHNCTIGNTTVKCSGEFADCAKQFNSCTC